MHQSLQVLATLAKAKNAANTARETIDQLKKKHRDTALVLHNAEDHAHTAQCELDAAMQDIAEKCAISGVFGEFNLWFALLKTANGTMFNATVYAKGGTRGEFACEYNEMMKSVSGDIKTSTLFYAVAFDTLDKLRDALENDPNLEHVARVNDDVFDDFIQRVFVKAPHVCSLHFGNALDL